mgnify:CR=1 FL=1
MTRGPFPGDAARPLLALAAALLAGAMTLGHGSVDAGLLVAVNHAAQPGAWWWAQVTTLGLGAAVLVIGSALAPLAGHNASRLTIALLWAIPIGGVLTHGVKALARLPRPAAVFGDGQLQVIGHALTSATNSMPSGHALAIVALAALWWIGGAPAWQRRALTVLAPLTALSRVAVAAHWPSDVLAGAALGTLTALVAWPLSAWGNARRQSVVARIAAVAVPALAGAWLLSGGTEQPQAEVTRHELAALGFGVAVAQVARFLGVRRLAQAWSRER